MALNTGFPTPGQSFPGSPGPPGAPGFSPGYPTGFAQGPPPIMPSPDFRGQAPSGGTSLVDTKGTFEENGIRKLNYRIEHRDCNSILVLNLLVPDQHFVKARPGSMVAMSADATIDGKFTWNFKKFLTSGEMTFSFFTGPVTAPSPRSGEVLLAPETWGDIVPIHIRPDEPIWSMSKDAFLACTSGIQITSKSQGLSKGLFSGEGIFVSQLTGNGIAFLQSLGAVMRRDLAAGEEWIVDNGHLVAWTCPYKVERIKTGSGGWMSSSHTGEGAVCRFTGPGTVYLQTRNPQALGEWIASQVPNRSSS